MVLLEVKTERQNGAAPRRTTTTTIDGNKIAELMGKDEDAVLEFVAKMNDLYELKLKRHAPFLTFVFCGLQSSGKSTIMERFLNSVLNIVQEGTGTRCPLDTTCLHDANCIEPVCRLSGRELYPPDNVGLKVDEVFRLITNHNQMLGKNDCFSAEPLRLTYRANNVQNMRFVDTPGIICTNLSQGKDNREDIKLLLESEMKKPNTKLCVLLEPTEMESNPILDFCDVTFGGKAWMEDAMFLMTKFDKQLEDTRGGCRANSFFKQFHDRGCFPYLVITPTLRREDLQPDELYEARTSILRSADTREMERFSTWCDGHDIIRREDPEESGLSSDVASRIGFNVAKTEMRKILLENAVKRLPEVIAEINKELVLLKQEKKCLEDKIQLSNPAELKNAAISISFAIKDKMLSYLDGDLQSTRAFPNMRQTLSQEIEEEMLSGWSSVELSDETGDEAIWREMISNLNGIYPDEVQPMEKFSGGKQVQRAMYFFKLMTIDALPDPHNLKEDVGNATGYLSGGLQRENWERAAAQVIQGCLREFSLPGVNYLIKHIGSIFGRLFRLALLEISPKFLLLPDGTVSIFEKAFDELLWELLVKVASKARDALEPMISTIKPGLPTFSFAPGESHDPRQLYCLQNGHYIATKSKKQVEDEHLLSAVKSRLNAFIGASADEVKDLLKKENASKSLLKKVFLPERRTGMIRSDEVDVVLKTAFANIVAVVDHNHIKTEAHIKHYLINGFKEAIGEPFTTKLMNENDWVFDLDPELISDRLAEVESNIESVEVSLLDAKKLYNKL